MRLGASPWVFFSFSYSTPLAMMRNVERQSSNKTMLLSWMMKLLVMPKTE